MKIPATHPNKTPRKKPHPVIARIMSMRDTIEYHLSRENRTLDEEFLLIINKESKLPARHREYIVDYYNHMAQKYNQANQKEAENETDQ
jgi:hypothetical protein